MGGVGTALGKVWNSRDKTSKNALKISQKTAKKGLSPQEIPVFPPQNFSRRGRNAELKQEKFFLFFPLSVKGKKINSLNLFIFIYFYPAGILKGLLFIQLWDLGFYIYFSCGF